MLRHVSAVQMEIHLKYIFYQRHHPDSIPDVVCCLRMEEMVELHHLFVQRVINARIAFQST